MTINPISSTYSQAVAQSTPASNTAATDNSQASSFLSELHKAAGHHHGQGDSSQGSSEMQSLLNALNGSATQNSAQSSELTNLLNSGSGSTPIW